MRYVLLKEEREGLLTYNNQNSHFSRATMLGHGRLVLPSHVLFVGTGIGTRDSFLTPQFSFSLEPVAFVPHRGPDEGNGNVGSYRSGISGEFENDEVAVTEITARFGIAVRVSGHHGP